MCHNGFVDIYIYIIYYIYTSCFQRVTNGQPYTTYMSPLVLGADEKDILVNCTLAKTDIDPDVLVPRKTIFLYQPGVSGSMLVVFQGVRSNCRLRALGHAQRNCGSTVASDNDVLKARQLALAGQTPIWNAFGQLQG